MVQFPLSFNEIGLWLAFTSVILLATSEVLSRKYGQSTILVDRKRMRKAALAFGLASILTIVIVIYHIIVSS